MNLENIIIQIIGFAGTGLFFLSFQCRENKNLFRVQLFSYLCYATHMFLLGATTGGISCFVNCLRSFCLQSKWNFTKSRLMCAILCGILLIAMIVTWNGPISLLPVIANIASTIGGYTKNPQKVRAAGMFINSPLWIVYSVIVGSLAGTLDEIISEISMISSVVRFGWKNLDRIEE